MVAGESGAVRGKTSIDSYVPLYTCPVPAKAIRGTAILRLGGMVNLSGASGAIIRVTLAQGAAEIVICQRFVQAGKPLVEWRSDVTISADRKYGFSDSLMEPRVQRGRDRLNARTRVNAIAFVSYSWPPTVETTLIDFDQPSEIRFSLGVNPADTVEMVQGFVDLVSMDAADADFVDATSTLFFGHSLVEGAGASPRRDVVSLLRGLRPGRPLTNLGLGGQRYGSGSVSFVDRILADPRARSRDLLIWGPENDASPDGPAWAATVLTRLAQVMAIRKAGSKTIICNGVTSTGWNAGIVAAARHVNAQLAASQWGPLVADMYTPICTAPGGYPSPAYLADAIHHNDAGYAIDAGTINAKMTSLGFA